MTLMNPKMVLIKIQKDKAMSNNNAETHPVKAHQLKEILDE